MHPAKTVRALRFPKLEASIDKVFYGYVECVFLNVQTFRL